MSPPDFIHRTSRSAHTGRRRRPAHRPRRRRCLLKGCERWFRPERAQERYCSVACRQAARTWARWKAQQRYRATAAGREKRNGQSRRYRERVCNRTQVTPEGSLPEGARVIAQELFSAIVAIDLAATTASYAPSGHPRSGSVRARADGPWSGSGNASGAGGAPSRSSGSGEERQRR